MTAATDLPACYIYTFYLTQNFGTLNKFHSFSDKALTLPLKCQLQLRCKAVRAQEAHNKQSLWFLHQACQ